MDKIIRKIESDLPDFMLVRPDSKFDENFARKLRAELLQTKIKPMESPYASFFVSRLFYGIVGSAITILLVVPMTYFITHKSVLPNTPVPLNPFSSEVKDVSSGLTPKQQISNKGTNAFGVLPLSTQTPTSTLSLQLGDYITFKYNGDPAALYETQGVVFKRTKDIDSSKQLADIIQATNFGLVKLSSFSNLNLKNIELSEDKTNGYTVEVNFENGSINVGAEKGYWTPATGTSSAISDSDAITIANSFISGHGLDLSTYDKPSVITSSSSLVKVAYPLLLDNKQVYQPDASVYGIVISIDSSKKQVSGLEGLNSQIYESSQYSLETDFSKVLAAATSTLDSIVSTPDQTPSLMEAFLGNPTHVLLRYMSPSQSASTTDELYIPAMRFTITYQSSSTQSSLPGSVVVPLVKDFLDKSLTLVQ